MFLDIFLLFGQCGLCLALVLSEPSMLAKFLAVGLLGVVILVFFNAVVPMHSSDPEEAQQQTIYL